MGRLYSSLALLFHCSELQTLIVETRNSGTIGRTWTFPDRCFPNLAQLKSLPCSQSLRSFSFRTDLQYISLLVQHFDEWLSDDCPNIQSVSWSGLKLPAGLRYFHNLPLQRLAYTTQSSSDEMALSEAKCLKAALEYKRLTLRELKIRTEFCSTTLQQALSTQAYSNLRVFNLSVHNGHSCYTQERLTVLLSGFAGISSLALTFESVDVSQFVNNLVSALNADARHRLHLQSLSLKFNSSTRQFQYSGAAPFLPLIEASKQYHILSRICIRSHLASFPDLVNKYGPLDSKGDYVSPRAAEHAIGWAAVKDFAQLWKAKAEGNYKRFNVELEVLFERRKSLGVNIGILKTGIDGKIMVFGKSS